MYHVAFAVSLGLFLPLFSFLPFFVSFWIDSRWIIVITYGCDLNGEFSLLELQLTDSLD